MQNLFEREGVRRSLKAIGVVLLLVLTSIGIGLAARANLLIPIAVPAIFVLGFLLRLLGKRAELVGWGLFTVWLGSTYSSTGQPVEYIILLIYMLLAALGIFRSSYFLAAAWLFHPIWDSHSRELPALLKDLPQACLIYDLPAGLYLLWGSWQGRWRGLLPLEAPASRVWVRLGKLLLVAGLVVVLSYLGLHYSMNHGGQAANWPTWTVALLGILTVGILASLGSKAEGVAWVVLTGWYAMTYAHAGQTLEVMVFLLAAFLGVMGIFASSWWFPVLWSLLLLWNFVPHKLPEGYEQLPTISTVFALPVVLYLWWATSKGRLGRFVGAGVGHWEPEPRISETQAHPSAL